MQLPTRLLQRNPQAHKGDFGHVFILAGSARFSGAALLCAEAAIRSGAGLVTLGIPESISLAIIKAKPKEVITLPLPETREKTLSQKAIRKVNAYLENSDVLVIGPGLSRNIQTQNLARKMIMTTKKPTIIDADGLNALVNHMEILQTKRDECATLVLTPHPGEMSRLIGMSIKKVQSERKILAQRFTQKHKVTLVLKGHDTVVTDYQGNLYINKTGNPGMATAGSGDVLTGMIAAFLGQGLTVFNAAKYAVYLHGLAGDLAAKEKTQISMIASDIISKIPEAIKLCNA